MAEKKFEDYVAEEAKKKGVEEGRINRWFESLSHTERAAIGGLTGGAAALAAEYLFNPVLAEYVAPLLALPAGVLVIDAIEKWHRHHAAIAEKKLEKVV